MTMTLYCVDVSGSKVRARRLFERQDAIFRWRSHGGGEAVVILPVPVEDPWYSCEEVPHDPAGFFRVLSIFAPFAWREVGGVVELAIVPARRGWWIGTKGSRIRLIQDYIGCKVRLVDLVGLMAPDPYPLPREVERKLVTRLVDPCRGYAVYGGLIAPWEDYPAEFVRKKIRDDEE